MGQSRNLTWDLFINDDGSWDIQRVQAQLLYDIREELKTLNRLLNCPNFIAIPRKLDSIQRKIPNRRKRKTTKD